MKFTGVGLLLPLRERIQQLMQNPYKLRPRCGFSGGGVKELPLRRLSSVDFRPTVESAFPRLKTSGAYEQRSLPDGRYNCIAFAAGEIDRWWWPSNRAGDYWPRRSPREETLAAFVSAFESIGYGRCADGSAELAYQKVVLYAKDGIPTHAARQEMTTAMWLSKLGMSYDIAHENVEDIGGIRYGEPILYLRRLA